MHPNDRSALWPFIPFDTTDALWRAYLACQHGQVVPAGSFVTVKNEVRVETEDMKTALVAYLDKHQADHPTLAQLREHYRSTGRFA